MHGQKNIKMVCSFWSDGNKPLKLDMDADHKHICML